MASVSSLAFVSIASRHVGEGVESFAAFQHSKVLNRQRQVDERDRRVKHEHGTRVTVRDLFGNLPVRSKQFALQFSKAENVTRGIEVIKGCLVALALAWPTKIKVTVVEQHELARRKFYLGSVADPSKESCREQRKAASFQLDYLYSVLGHAGYVMPSEIGTWTTLSAKSGRTFVRAAVSTEPAPSKQCQFISIGIHPLDARNPASQTLYGDVNATFANSSFGSVTIDEPQRGFEYPNCKQKPARKMGGPKIRGPDRWPMFYIRIETQDSGISKSIVDSKEDDREASVFLEKTMQLLRSMMLEFLHRHDCSPKPLRDSPSKRKPGRLDDPRKGTPPTPLDVLKGLSHEVGRSWETSVEDGDVSGSNPSRDSASHHFAKAASHSSHGLIPFSLHSKMRSGRPRAGDRLYQGNEVIESAEVDLDHSSRSGPSGVGSKAQSYSTTEEPGGYDALESSRSALVDQDSGCTQEGEASTETQEQASSTPMTGKEQDGTLHWTDSTSGKKFRIDHRTGSLLPEQSALIGSTPVPSERPSSKQLRIPMTTKERLFQSVSGTGNDATAPRMWVSNLLKVHRGSTFQNRERSIPCSGAPAVQESVQSSMSQLSRMRINGEREGDVAAEVRLSKTALRNAEVLGQVDGKFILVVMKISPSTASCDLRTEELFDTLVLIDQHAADERYRVEKLFTELESNTRVTLAKPIHLTTTHQEAELFRRAQDGLHFWGLRFKIRPIQPKGAKHDLHPEMCSRTIAKEPSRGTPGLPHVPNCDEKLANRVVITALPAVIAERCRLEPKLLIDLVRSEVWSQSENRQAMDYGNNDQAGSHTHSWLRNIARCPRGIIEIVNSRACRSAIMFNDELTQSECGEVVQRLSRCAFPFQCAHGRPSMVILGRLEHDRDGVPCSPGPSRSFSQAFTEWKT